MAKNKMKNGDANNNPALILILAIVFIIGGGAGLYCLFTQTISDNKVPLTIVSIVITLVGILLFVTGIIRSKELKKLLLLRNDPHAYKTMATFVSAKISSYTSKSSSVGVGNVSIPTSYSLTVYKKVIYSYTDQNGVSHTAKSILSYSPNQVDYLQKKSQFAIICDGALSDIVEEIPDTQKTVDFKL